MLVMETIGRGWNGFLGRLADLLFPPRCVVCRQDGEWLCADCVATFVPVTPPLCRRCGDSVPVAGLCPRCRTAPLRIDGIRSLYYFDGALRDVIHEFKYNGIKVLATPLGRAMAEGCASSMADVDVAVPVPLHRKRVWDRGYNQSGLLAHVVADQLGLGVDECALVRQRSTRPQVELDARARRTNVRDAFACNGDSLSGRRVLLIDDVCTTGATLEACAVALYAGGAQVVRALTLARAR